MKKAIINLGSLTAIQGANALAPLVIFPYALYALRSSSYAEMALAEAISAFILAFVIFSFDITGVSRVVQLRLQQDAAGISHVFSAILYIRLFLFALALPVALALYHFALGGPWQIMLLWSLVPLSYILQSAWFFQGMESNFPAAVCAVVSRVACVALIFWLVRGSQDTALVPAIMGACYLLGGLATFCVALVHNGMRLQPVAWRELFRMVGEGKETFLGNFSVSLYRDSNLLILGLAGVAAPALAAYSVAEKLIKCLQAVARPLSQFFFPRVIRRLHGESQPNPLVGAAIMRLTLPQMAALLLVTLGLIAAYMVALRVFPGVAEFPNRDDIVAFCSVMVLAVFFGLTNFMLGVVGLNHLGGHRYLFAVILAVGLLSAITCLLLAPLIGAWAGVYCFVGSEIFLFLLIARKYHRA